MMIDEAFEDWKIDRKVKARLDWESDMRAWEAACDEPVCCDECKYWADGICTLSEEETNDDESCRWGCRMKGADDE